LRDGDEDGGEDNQKTMCVGFLGFGKAEKRKEFSSFSRSETSPNLSKLSLIGLVLSVPHTHTSHAYKTFL